MDAVSIIIPTYNRARSISRTIDSVLKQAHAPAEIIVVNDGSTDDTVAVLNAYHPAVRLINIDNVGPTGARLTGVRAAKSDWLAFCDSDDLWHPDHLSCLVRLVVTNDVPFAFSNFTHITDKKRAERSHFEADPDGFWMKPGRSVGGDGFVADMPLFAEVLRYQAIFPSCSLVRRDYFDRIGGLNPSLGRNPSEDLEFTLRCVKGKPVGIVVRSTVDIYRHDRNYTGDWIRTLAGSTEILKYSRDNHGLAEELRSAVGREIISRSIHGIDCCFIEKRFEDVSIFARNLSETTISRKTAIKINVSAQPRMVAMVLSSALAACASSARFVRLFRSAGVTG